MLRIRQLFVEAGKEKLDEVAKNKLVEGLTLLAHYHKLLPASYLSCVALPQDSRTARRVKEVETDRSGQSNALLKLAEGHIQQSLAGGIPHKERRKLIETALKLLINSVGQQSSSETMSLLARAYYLRSLIIRPKGFTVPAKKPEALKQARKWAEDALKLTENSSSKDAHRVRGMACLELEKVGQIDEDELITVLEDGILDLLEGCTDFDINAKDIAEDVAIATRRAEIVQDTDMANTILALDIDGISFEKARAACVANDTDAARKWFTEHLKHLRRSPFLDPLWGETVFFLLRLKRKGKRIWEEFALQALKACQVQERRTKNAHLRWYWSGLQELYDLAFLAAEDSEKAEIADSLKSRIPLRWKAMEDMDRDEVAVYEAALLGRYVKGHAGQGSGGAGQTPAQIKSPSFDVPEGWIAIHFYLSSLAGEGYAVIKHEGDDAKWEIRPFKTDRLFAECLSWQSAYTAYAEEAAASLVALCRTIGQEMSFLFELPKGPQKILFIPHGFLHRLPLHAAIDKNDRLLLEDRVCAYLPAWSFTADTASMVSAVGPDEALSFWEDGGDAKVDDLLKSDLSDAPISFTLNCHGLADPVNPFGARLFLKDGAVTLRQILDSSRSLQGSRVFLGACQTDMVPPLSVTLDEHLSLASVFIIKGAREVAGGLYNASKPTIYRIEEILRAGGDSSLEAIREDQSKMAELWRNKKDPLVIYDSIVFRVFIAKPV